MRAREILRLKNINQNSGWNLASGRRVNWSNVLIPRWFQAQQVGEGNNFRRPGKVSSSMSWGEGQLTSLLKRIRSGPWQSRPIDREHNLDGENKIVRRQFGAGGATAGSSRAQRLDPSSLPVQFDTRDARADGGLRHVEIHRETVVLRRAVRGMRMAVNVRVHDFRGIAVRATDDGHLLVLVHRDPSLSIPLQVSAEREEIEEAALHWGAALTVPLIEDAITSPALRRRRHNMIRSRRPKILMRRRNGAAMETMAVHRDEHEIIART
jgi:hypothetical protein